MSGAVFSEAREVGYERAHAAGLDAGEFEHGGGVSGAQRGEKGGGVRPESEPVDSRITVETDLFDHRVVKPHFINPCCFGEDFTIWLKERVAPLSKKGFNFSESIQEDYGWGFWANHSRDTYWVAISYVGDGPQEEPAQWVISVNYDPGLNLVKRLFHKPDGYALSQLREGVCEALTSNPGIRIVSFPAY